MADHDQNAGSRGEEEAPRDPTPSEGTGGLRQPPEEPGDRLRYGEFLEGPGPRSGYRRQQDTMPGVPGPGARERESTFGDFFRQKQAQIIGAGLIGLVVGGLLGGGAVLFVSSVTDRNAPSEARWAPGWGPRQDFHHPGGIVSSCGPRSDGVYCVVPPPIGDPLPPVTVRPVPTRTG
ncbi:hypothetical protein ABGB18_24090 [Nonomuraea sp. B12E4]|uniref:hypothetical protein n=1 Tax=Nonomuraea sp. B12E4 TaxID=3153564 RepID=UPI00325E3400